MFVNNYEDPETFKTTSASSLYELVTSSLNPSTSIPINTNINQNEVDLSDTTKGNKSDSFVLTSGMLIIIAEIAIGLICLVLFIHFIVRIIKLKKQRSSKLNGNPSMINSNPSLDLSLPSNIKKQESHDSDRSDIGLTLSNSNQNINISNIFSRDIRTHPSPLDLITGRSFKNSNNKNGNNVPSASQTAININPVRVSLPPLVRSATTQQNNNNNSSSAHVATQSCQSLGLMGPMIPPIIPPFGLSIASAAMSSDPTINSPQRSPHIQRSPQRSPNDIVSGTPSIDHNTIRPGGTFGAYVNHNHNNKDDLSKIREETITNTKIMFRSKGINREITHDINESKMDNSHHHITARDNNKINKRKNTSNEMLFLNDNYFNSPSTEVLDNDKLFDKFKLGGGSGNSHNSDGQESTQHSQRSLRSSQLSYRARGGSSLSLSMTALSKYVNLSKSDGTGVISVPGAIIETSGNDNDADHDDINDEKDWNEIHVEDDDGKLRIVLNDITVNAGARMERLKMAGVAGLETAQALHVRDARVKSIASQIEGGYDRSNADMYGLQLNPNHSAATASGQIEGKVNLSPRSANINSTNNAKNIIIEEKRDFVDNIDNNNSNIVHHHGNNGSVKRQHIVQDSDVIITSDDYGNDNGNNGIIEENINEMNKMEDIGMERIGNHLNSHRKGSGKFGRKKSDSYEKLDKDKRMGRKRKDKKNKRKGSKEDRNDKDNSGSSEDSEDNNDDVNGENDYRKSPSLSSKNALIMSTIISTSGYNSNNNSLGQPQTTSVRIGKHEKRKETKETTVSELYRKPEVVLETEE